MEIPKYPDSRPVFLEDRQLMHSVFIRMQPSISEFTFANIFLFRHAHEYRISVFGESLVILGRGYDGTEYFLPPLEGNISSAADGLLSEGLTLYGADRAFLDRCLPLSEHLEVMEDRDSHDYLYLRSDLAELPGNRYHKKKNRVNYFSSRHSYMVEHYASRHLKGALDLLKVWGDSHKEPAGLSLRHEIKATAEGLERAEELGLDGVVVMIEGDVKAFALGERLNSVTSVCHFEKGDPFLEGVSQLADREFNRICFTDCVYVNREQDLGEPNLRRAKLSYHPVEMVEKFRVRYLR
ncbi:MAG: phosphatidylglycerol lysyltransferase domain-containing protein [Geobacteraceae bacterium]|nr:phosphatidylglycerol lysyltransferase domain-containing protein [Geobacteraceae bacterium]